MMLNKVAGTVNVLHCQLTVHGIVCLLINKLCCLPHQRNYALTRKSSGLGTN